MKLLETHKDDDVKVGVISTLLTGVTKDVGNVRLERVRTLAITCKVTYHASATSGVTVKLYYNNPKIGLDTIPFASFVPTLTAGATVQRTVLIDCPESSDFNIKVKNDDGTHPATNINVGSSVKRWA